MIDIPIDIQQRVGDEYRLLKEGEQRIPGDEFILRDTDGTYRYWPWNVQIDSSVQRNDGPGRYTRRRKDIVIHKTWRFILRLAPAILKNNKSVSPVRLKSGKMAYIPFMNKKVKRFMTEAKKQLLAQEHPDTPLDYPMIMKCMMFGPWEADSETMPDVSNLYQAVEDVLQDAGIIRNDRLIEGHDGSRRVPMCYQCEYKALITRGKRKGQLKDSCGHKNKCAKACIVVDLIPFNTSIHTIREQHPDTIGVVQI